MNEPALSVIVISEDGDGDRLERTVRSIVEQECPEPFEVIVVTAASSSVAGGLRTRFPTVTVIQVPGPTLPGAARNAGLRHARGAYVSFPGSHIELRPGSLAARLRAHRSGHPLVTGTILNGTETRPGWAAYFLDHHVHLPGRPGGELDRPPVSCSYPRRLLREAGGFPEDMRMGEDTAVNNALWEAGHTAYRSPDIGLVHFSPCTTVPRLLRHHFLRGRGLGRLVLDQRRERGGVVRRHPHALRRYLSRRVSRIDEHVDAWGGELRDTYRDVRRLVVAGLVAALCGAWFEVLRPGRGKLRALFGRPARYTLTAR